MELASKVKVAVLAGVLGILFTFPVSAKVNVPGEVKGLQNTLREVAKQVNPCVVLVYVEKKAEVKGGGQGFNYDFEFHFNFKKYFRGEGQDDDGEEESPLPKRKIPEQRSQGMGSGFIITQDGWLVTNYHVIEDATDVKVTLLDETKYDAEVKGYDKRHDIALLKIKSDKKFPSTGLGNSDETMVGDLVIALGNPFGYSNTVTMGIVSAKGRLFDNLEGNGAMKRIPNIIQTDAAINPGNSGGPLCNIEGDVIGVNMAIAGNFSIGSVGNMGVGFAIPINDVKKLLDELMKGKKSTAETPWVGIRLQELDKKLTKRLGIANGVLIPEVDETGPGKEAGLVAGDVVVKLDGKEVSTPKQLASAVANKEVGDYITLTVNRNGKEKEIKIVLAPWGEKNVKGKNKENKEAEKKTSELGVEVKDINERTARAYGLKAKKGVVVVSVEKNSLADKADIKEGDVIKEIDRKEIKDLDSFVNAVKSLNHKEGALFLIERIGGSMYVVVGG